jgi:hypothetical protein
MDFAGSEVRIPAGKGGHKDKKLRNVMSRRTVLSGGQEIPPGSSSWSLRGNMFSSFKLDLPYTV